MQIPQLGQIIFDKNWIFSLSVRIHLIIEVVSKNSSAQTVLMNMWNEVFTKLAEIFLHKFDFFPTFVFSFLRYSYWRVVYSIDNPIELFPTKTEKFSIMVRERWQKKCFQYNLFSLETFLWTCRVWLITSPGMFFTQCWKRFLPCPKLKGTLFFLKTVFAQ